jgi:hypothetical protein
MRRILFLSTIAAVALATAAAAQAAPTLAARVPGSEPYEIGKGEGYAVLGNRGAALGNLGGRIVLIDIAGGGSPEGYVRGCRKRSGSFTSRLVCRGPNVRFLIYGGTWRVRLNGTSIDVSGRLRGKLGLERAEGGSGWYTIDFSSRRRWPATLTFFVVRS